MWSPGRPAAEQCEGCTFYTSQVAELSYLHSRDITYAVFCQGRNVAFGGAESHVSYEKSVRYRDFMGWHMPWYSAQPSLDALLVGRRRGVEALDYSYALMDLTVYGRQEQWEDSPPGWPQQCSNVRTDGGSPDWPPVSQWPGGRPTVQWPRLEAGRSDHLGTTGPPTDPTIATGHGQVVRDLK